jgi:diguanylate cyclase (GGDEF)-like protein/PAS domain S-box-containing protein
MDLLFKLNPAALTLLIPGLISTALALYSFNIRNISGSKIFGLVNAAVVLSSLAYGAELLCLNLEGMLFSNQLSYLGIAALPVLWLLMTLQYTGRTGWVNSRSVPFLFILPALTVILVFTNQYHHLFYSSLGLDTGGPVPYLSVTRGIWYWINAGYSYLILLISIILLLKKLRRSNPAYRPQVISLLIGVAVPSAVNLLHPVFGIVLFGYVNLTPFAFVVSGLVLTWSIFRYGLFSIVPIAREWVIENMKEGIVVIDTENILLDMNKSSRDILGLGNSDLGKPITGILPGWPEITNPHKSNKSLHTQIAQGKEGLNKYFEITSSTLTDRKGRIFGRLVTIRDITEWKVLENKLEQMATHDPLTGLPGRILLVDRVNVAITHAKRKNCKLALIMLDLDHFKSVNDTLGHKTGDEVLKAVSGKLKDTLRKNDTIARLGGDEFVVLLPEIVNFREAQGAADRLLDSFQKPVCVDAHTLQISLSLGITIFPDDGNNFSDLLKQADTAMYRAKAKGGNGYEFFGVSELVT